MSISPLPSFNIWIPQPHRTPLLQHLHSHLRMCRHFLTSPQTFSHLTSLTHLLCHFFSAGLDLLPSSLDAFLSSLTVSKASSIPLYMPLSQVSIVFSQFLNLSSFSLLLSLTSVYSYHSLLSILISFPTDYSIVLSCVLFPNSLTFLSK